jgi:uncharacterized protein YjbI with pentapeptide repeats
VTAVELQARWNGSLCDEVWAAMRGGVSWEAVLRGRPGFGGEVAVADDLRGIDLRGRVIDGVDLCHARLEYARLDRCSARALVLQGARLDGVSMEGSVLASASLLGTTASGARFDHADLSGADLSGVRWEGASLRGAHMVRVRMPRAHLLRCDLRDVDLTHADLYEVRLVGCEVSGARRGAAPLEGHLSGVGSSRG